MLVITRKCGSCRAQHKAHFSEFGNNLTRRREARATQRVPSPTVRRSTSSAMQTGTLRMLHRRGLLRSYPRSPGGVNVCGWIHQKSASHAFLLDSLGRVGGSLGSNSRYVPAQRHARAHQYAIGLNWIENHFASRDRPPSTLSGGSKTRV